MKNKILELIEAYPKHFSRMIQRNKELFVWVKTNTLITDDFPAEIYSALNQVSNTCENGKTKKYKNITIGFGFCGKANECQCCKESVSQKVSVAKTEYTKDIKNQIQEKRESTSLTRYGVINNAQTTKAKEAHKLLYEDKILSNAITEKVKQTKLEKYNNSGFNNREKAKQTCIQKYGVDNPWLTRANNTNPNLDILKDKTQLASWFPKFSVEEISEKLAVNVQTVYRYLGIHEFRVPYKSTFEQEIIHYLGSLGVTNIISNSRSIIGKELDIYLPDYKLAIEYNGVYWHHDKISHITKTYHYDKFIECEKLGITLFSIFGNSWDGKKDIWKAKIKQKLKLNPNKIYARKCKLVVLPVSKTRDILNQHHIQGYCVAQYCYGLEYNNELVACMTFSKKRHGVGKDRGDEAYELVRYVTTTTIIGGASKLLAQFKKDMNPKIIYSYSDNQYSSGNLYKILGFDFEKENASSYWYYDPNKKISHHRLKFTKFKLVEAGHDKNKTEHQIMDELGYLRIWDCGTRTWVLS